ncbi:hypothetical protein [Tuwongella immobilis]|uniref:Uncharacterized protein n=1 Tax=Tuwongella immobilis TaxID=692036 RepID=A0A6C2YKW8_9BACT|nr:hypothetical protein [Tuwongella immobilis]VIP02024.1 Uncharacterized protein OS=Acidobacterium capsulatum (strain ATCC 51196 / DSM 11244 / JCM 7670) GN=ACP_0309 PE=4 SV=1 [Tuwongella immobilis]VTS00159.1 Uncharacterized protein OS=Acidobacterium capsulatum (strain ATCC 51196 / DSM 11244 / JCM 7670) GN=ACP_0309 PE=4 SV=1 [Tuwongella immobilis]
MAKIALLAGLLLIGIGCASYFGTGTESKTALIPAGFGAGLTVCGLISLAKPSLNKHVMHAAAMIGLLGTIGGLVPTIRQVVKTGSVDFTSPPFLAGAGLTVVSAGFVFLCVRSFIAARKAREAAEGKTTPTA